MARGSAGRGRELRELVRIEVRGGLELELNEVSEGHPMLAPGSASGDVGADARRSGATAHCCRSLPVDGRPQAEGKRAKRRDSCLPYRRPQIRPPPPPPSTASTAKDQPSPPASAFAWKYSSRRLGPTSALRSCTSVRPPPAVRRRVAPSVCCRYPHHHWHSHPPPANHRPASTSTLGLTTA